MSEKHPMLLRDLLDLDLLAEMIGQKYVRAQDNPSRTLTIFNYTEHAQFDRAWNDVTRQCRGLIVAGFQSSWLSGKPPEVVARPFPKFFNYGEPEAAALDMDAPAYISDKMDGSLGILYPDEDRCRIATRGSFTSHQAVYATSLLWERYFEFRPPGGITVLCEIIFPDNRIVLDYGNTHDLYLLGGVDITDGGILAPGLIPHWHGPIAEIMSAVSLREALALPPRENAEGVVVRVGRHMVKLKQADYIALHRIITNTSARVIWEHLAVIACRHLIVKPKDWASFLHLDPKRAEEVLAAGEDWQDKMLHGVPDEFYGWFKETTGRLTTEVSYLQVKVNETFACLRGRNEGDRKGFALDAREYSFSGMLFQLLDGRDITANLWVAVYPPAEKPWGQRSEDVA